MKEKMVSIWFCGVIALLSGCGNADTQKAAARRDSTVTKKEAAAAADTIADLSDLITYDSTNSNRVVYDSVYKITTRLSDSTYQEDVYLLYQHTRIQVESVYLDDSVARDEPNLFNPVCLSQHLLFYQDQVLKKIQEHPVRKIVQRVASGKKVEMLEDIINYFGLMRGKQGLLVITNGYGGCNSCSEFLGVYSTAGVRLWYVYRTRFEVYKEEGDLKKVFRDYKANEQEMDKALYSKLNIY